MGAIQDRFVELHPHSQRLAEEGRRLFPDGVTHDIRRMVPFPVYVDHAQGSRKWDVDGNEIIDYIMGHGALLMGHAHPKMVAAVEQQVRKGTHYGASHELELRWAGLVKHLVSCAELVRFTSSGTEATMMALRLARAFTGKDRILKFDHHFHGWHDYVVGERTESGSVAMGVPKETLANVVVIPQNDLRLVEQTLDQESDIAAVIIEPTGYHWGAGPTAVPFLKGLRELTKERNVVLIFDEVITGFRASKGGAQEYFGIKPDMCSMAKIVAGGLPGGAVAGRADVLGMIDSGDESLNRSAKNRVSHPGTFNANPLSAAAGIAALEEIATGAPNRAANETAVKLHDALNAAYRAEGVAGRCFGVASMLHYVIGKPCPEGGFEWPDPMTPPPATDGKAAIAFKQSMLNEGVEFMGDGMMVSSVHTEADVARTAEAFQKSLRALKAENLI